MTQRIMASLVFMVALSAVKLSAQASQAQLVPTGPMPYAKSANLTPVQQDGTTAVYATVFDLSHAGGSIGQRTSVPVLTKDLFAGSDNAIRQIIMTGTDRMPGYRYGLTPSQISSIIEYLKTGMEATEIDQSGPAPAKGK